MAPRVSFHTFERAAAKTKASYHRYTPAADERDAEARVPVVYWLHGSGGGAAGIAQLAKFVHGAIQAGKTHARADILTRRGLAFAWHVALASTPSRASGPSPRSRGDRG